MDPHMGLKDSLGNLKESAGISSGAMGPTGTLKNLTVSLGVLRNLQES